jgi:hypothetical protein
MKQAILFAVGLTVSICSFAQINTAVEGSLRPEEIKSVIIDDAAVQNIVGQIMSVTGLQTNFTLKESKVRNIEASVSHRRRYILYNRDFLSQIMTATNSKWETVALFAHEVGHHLNGHTLRRSGSTPELELEADEFAGFVLQKLGASLEEAQSVMKYISTTKGSKTHPAREARLLAIKNGWMKAGNTFREETVSLRLGN